MRIGVAYYPEHWPEERWAVDARMMREAGIEVVRVAEFAWSRLEPRRGQYDMEWLERAIEALAAEGLQVIMCTPTAAPPQWLFVRHPGMVPQDREGRNWFPGSRRHACLNNRPYRRYVRRIVREVARSFGSRPEVVAWQIDNELGCHESGRCYCDDCEQAFREWLKGRYGIIDRLNKLWGTAFWSQHFNDWHEIPAPRRTPAGAHPSLVLDYKRFMSATFRDFVADQRELIEQYGGGDKPITTNSIGLHLHQIDQFSFCTSQDVATVDNYPVDRENLDAVAIQLDLTRSARRRPFWVLEQQAGATMIRGRRGQPRPGQLRLWSYQSAARGAELISYFRWRTCAYAQEMHWYGMLEPDGRTRRRYQELTETIGELKGKAGAWEGRLPDAKVALVLDYHSHWALEADSMAAGLDYLGQFRALHRILRRWGLVADMLPPDGDAAGYSLLMAPMPVIVREATAGLWQSFVRQGGTLLVTAPAGYRTEHNTWGAAPPPGPLSGLLGVEVVEHDMLGGGQGNTAAFEEAEFPACSFCTVVELQEAEALAEFTEHYYAGSAAMTRNAVGEGTALYLGAVGGDGLYEHALGLALAEAGLERHPWSSQFVEVIALEGAEDEAPLVFVLNHSDEAVELPVPEGQKRRDLIGDEEHAGIVELDPHGVVLLEG
jgi:beta-galactosidase